MCSTVGSGLERLARDKHSSSSSSLARIKAVKSCITLATGVSLIKFLFFATKLECLSLEIFAGTEKEKVSAMALRFTI